MKRQFLAIRKASLMEDEGRPDYLGVRDTREEAQKLIDDFCTRSKGYFTPGECYITEIIERQ